MLGHDAALKADGAYESGLGVQFLGYPPLPCRLAVGYLTLNQKTHVRIVLGQPLLGSRKIGNPTGLWSRQRKLLYVRIVPTQPISVDLIAFMRYDLLTPIKENHL